MCDLIRSMCGMVRVWWRLQQTGQLCTPLVWIPGAGACAWRW